MPFFGVLAPRVKSGYHHKRHRSPVRSSLRFTLRLPYVPLEPKFGGRLFGTVDTGAVVEDLQARVASKKLDVSAVLRNGQFLQLQTLHERRQIMQGTAVEETEFLQRHARQRADIVHPCALKAKDLKTHAAKCTDVVQITGAQLEPNHRRICQGANINDLC